MADETLNKIEREYVIPLRHKWKIVPRYKRANKAVRTVKEFLVRHMKIRDKDLRKIKIDRYLNEELWFRGIRKPPAKIKVKAVRDGEIVKVELAELPEKLKFKKLKEEKKLQASTKSEKAHIHKEGEEHEHIHKEQQEKKEEEKEKKAAVVEEGQKIEEALAKKTKHTTKPKAKKKQKSEEKDYNKSSRGR
ncbi:MAG TPA: 50S ribosomal protein L31e [Candidatus Nanoarchaeia archaeon]|nr:50S ribosomal protein L31e [Candidatus Nanoarchaeia archaeon]